jgi:pilus assembly protein CpaF
VSIGVGVTDSGFTDFDHDLMVRVRGRLVGATVELTTAAVASAVRAEGGVLGDAAVLVLARRLRSEFAGLGPLEPLIGVPGITDVVVVRPDEIWIDSGSGLVRVSVSFSNEAAVRKLAQRVAAQAGLRLDESAPWVDVSLPGGLRFHAVIPPVAVGGTYISVRVLPRRLASLAELVSHCGLTPYGAEILAAVVTRRLSFLVTGGTGTGKTTLLTAMLSEVPKNERIVLVEDVAELMPQHPHVVRLVTRPPNIEGAGEISLRSLVRQALRMRPDRLVVGEVRGAEVSDLLAAMNTGHDGACGTVHSGDPADLPARIVALAAQAGMSAESALSQLAAAVDIVIHLRRSDGQRTMAAIAMVEPASDVGVAVTAAVQFDSAGFPVAGPAAARLQHLLRTHVLDSHGDAAL